MGGAAQINQARILGDHSIVEASAVIIKFLSQASVAHREDLRRQQAGIEASTDGDSGHRDPPRHLSLIHI